MVIIMFFFFLNDNEETAAESKNVIIYQSEDSNISTQVIFKDETFWMSQKEIANLFGVDITTINYHLKEIYKTEELSENSTIAIFPIVQTEGTRTSEYII